jgi:phosphoserine phosphatase
VIAIGDGANDLTMMRVAAAGIAYHAKPIVQAQASYALNYAGLDGIANLFSTI